MMGKVRGVIAMKSLSCAILLVVSGKAWLVAIFAANIASNVIVKGTDCHTGWIYILRCHITLMPFVVDNSGNHILIFPYFLVAVDIFENVVKTLTFGRR
jgi:hypothetical protein